MKKQKAVGILRTEMVRETEEAKEAGINALCNVAWKGKATMKDMEAIVGHSFSALKYAVGVLKGRFEFGEEAIARHQGASFMYAKLALKGRFEKGEDMMRRVPSIWARYEKEVLAANGAA